MRVSQQRAAGRVGRFAPLAVLAFAGTFVATLVAQQGCASAASQVVVGRHWPAAQRVSMDQIDHSAWDALLQRYVDTRGMVNYQGWKATSNDMRALDQYLATLSKADPRKPASKPGKMAFWINAYNAVTIRGILREYPTSSIRNHTPKVFGYNIWDDLLLWVGDQKYSLNQMEHQVLRKMGDPRVHFAIVCASIGCPRLLNRAYVPDRLDEQLDENARNFFANPAKFRYDARSRRIAVSPILKWFAEDFGADMAQRLRTIAPYLPTDEARRLATSGSAEVSYLDYDWSLNDQARAKTARR